jgi:hypothetical protein
MFLSVITGFELFLFVFQLFLPVWLVLEVFLMDRIITEHTSQVLGDLSMQDFDF